MHFCQDELLAIIGFLGWLPLAAVWLRAKITKTKCCGHAHKVGSGRVSKTPNDNHI